MKLPSLKIGHLTARVPIVQGGMAVRVSTAPLSAAVAEAGGIGLIAASGLTAEEVAAEIRRAKLLTKGILGINVMFAVNNFMEIVKTAIAEKIDLIVFGAGFSRDIFSIGAEAGVPIVPIVSTAKLAKISQKLGAAAVILEGKEAGGHLGTDISMWELLPEVRAAIDIPLIAAGSVTDGHDIARAFRMGANGVQMGTRFVLTTECEAAPAFKAVYTNAKPEDIVIIQSSVGLPGRAIRNVFVDRLERGETIPPKKMDCRKCLKHCSHRFCIIEALINAQQGDIDNGLVFAGEHVYRAGDIMPVKEVFQRLLAEVEEESEVD